MDIRKHESQIQQKGDEFILEIKTKVMWEQEEMEMMLNKRVTAELSLKKTGERDERLWIEAFRGTNELNLGCCVTIYN